MPECSLFYGCDLCIYLVICFLFARSQDSSIGRGAFLSWLVWGWLLRLQEGDQGPESGAFPGVELHEVAVWQGQGSELDLSDMQGSKVPSQHCTGWLRAGDGLNAADVAENLGSGRDGFVIEGIDGCEKFCFDQSA